VNFAVGGLSPKLLLSDEEIELLSRALREWGGPAHCSDEMAVAMGFESVGDLLAQTRRIAAALRSDETLMPIDWARAMLSAEIVFASDLSGSGVDWRTTTGYTDEYTIRIIRSIQRKLVKIVSPFFGKVPGRD
jgi:hypothetical protein